MDTRRGIAYGVAAYVMWGLVPLFWPLLQPAGAIELLSHRFVWSLLLMVFLIVALRRVRPTLALVRNRRTALLLAVAAVTITSNWGFYIWGVNTGRVVETSLGYFINPLVSIAMGVLIFRERLRRMQWLALGVAMAAIVVLTVDYGHAPWLALVLAFSFGTYGLVKKAAGAGAFDSLTVETAYVAPLALVYLIVLGSRGHFAGNPGHMLLFAATGIVTALPLICFGAAATRVPMVTLGLLQYLAPILQFAIGVLIRHEPMSTGRWIGFSIVWVALAIFAYDAVRVARSVRGPGVLVSGPGGDLGGQFAGGERGDGDLLEDVAQG
ncbi:protein RarD [Nocardioides baekrokdamisoli]|uniref:Protein RarD n=1 Tax=Nocardioides baekrokdamisoli TaxID=1804624 RepID=A0A3G9IHP1_9ACTN|nr:EamA family transporter RarD [Nocardioides baekrokdamisoli]BBH17866.1 protein RarD [Nocardioides baekrokdamisoli]